MFPFSQLLTGRSLNLLTQFVHAVGQVALKMLIFIERIEKKVAGGRSKDKTSGKEEGSEGSPPEEAPRGRAKKKKEGKKVTVDEELEMIAGGKDAEVEQELNYIQALTESHLLQKNLLSHFAPIVVQIAERFFA